MEELDCLELFLVFALLKFIYGEGCMKLSDLVSEQPSGNQSINRYGLPCFMTDYL